MKRMKGVCLVCKKEFDIPEKAHNKKYCCSTCTKKAWKINNREKYLSSSKKYNKKYYVKSKPVKRLCLVCGHKFLANVHNPYQVYCSPFCRSKYSRISNREKYLQSKKEERKRNHKRYKDSSDFYHNKTRFDGNRYLALIRDKYTCQICYRDRKEVKLVVHHKDGNGPNSINPNNDLSNLVTLCRSCHCKVHNILSIKH